MGSSTGRAGNRGRASRTPPPAQQCQDATPAGQPMFQRREQPPAIALRPPAQADVTGQAERRAVADQDLVLNQQRVRARWRRGRASSGKRCPSARLRGPPPRVACASSPASRASVPGRQRRAPRLRRSHTPRSPPGRRRPPSSWTRGLQALDQLHRAHQRPQAQARNPVLLGERTHPHDRLRAAAGWRPPSGCRATGTPRPGSAACPGGPAPRPAPPPRRWPAPARWGSAGCTGRRRRRHTGGRPRPPRRRPPGIHPASRARQVTSRAPQAAAAAVGSENVGSTVSSVRPPAHSSCTSVNSNSAAPLPSATRSTGTSQAAASARRARPPRALGVAVQPGLARWPDPAPAAARRG